MAYDLEEQESIDQMKAWWDKWGTPVCAAVCVVCLTFAGWNGWNWYKANQAAKASGAYVQLQNAIFQKDAKNVGSISTGLMQEYGTTIYAPLGALVSSQYNADQGDFASAELALRWVIEKSGHAEYDTLARVRLAGLLLTQDKLEEAAAVLKDAKPEGEQQVEIDDRWGDYWLAKGDNAKAREFWEKAKNEARMQNPLMPLLQYKIGSLPTDK